MLLPSHIIKLAKSIELKRLIEAKKLSDKNDYVGKNTILRELLQEYPKQFRVDQILNDKYVGLTHKPSGFKIHTARTLIPAGMEHTYDRATAKK